MDIDKEIKDIDRVIKETDELINHVDATLEEHNKMFNKAKYDNEYQKQHYKKIHTAIKKEEAEKLEELLKKHSMNKAEFIRWAINELEKKN